jgi:hypothetical protein
MELRRGCGVLYDGVTMWGMWFVIICFGVVPMFVITAYAAGYRVDFRRRVRPKAVSVRFDELEAAIKGVLESINDPLRAAGFEFLTCAKSDVGRRDGRREWWFGVAYVHRGNGDGARIQWTEVEERGGSRPCGREIGAIHVDVVRMFADGGGRRTAMKAADWVENDGGWQMAILAGYEGVSKQYARHLAALAGTEAAPHWRSVTNSMAIEGIQRDLATSAAKVVGRGYAKDEKEEWYVPTWGLALGEALQAWNAEVGKNGRKEARGFEVVMKAGKK